MSYSIAQGDLIPHLAATLRDLIGAVVNLSSGVDDVQFLYRRADRVDWNERMATIVDAALGKVEYAWQSGETGIAGDYEARFRVNYSNGDTLLFPNTSPIPFFITPTTDSTPLARYRACIRSLLGDGDPDIHIYENEQIDDAIRMIVDTGQLPPSNQIGPPIPYISSSLEITPALTPVTNQAAFAILVYKSAKVFADAITISRWTTRAFSESFGDGARIIESVVQRIYEMENGDGCS